MCGEHLTSWEDIEEMPFFQAGTTNHLSKCLTRDIWD